MVVRSGGSGKRGDVLNGCGVSVLQEERGSVKTDGGDGYTTK